MKKIHKILAVAMIGVLVLILTACNDKPVIKKLYVQSPVDTVIALDESGVVQFTDKETEGKNNKLSVWAASFSSAGANKNKLTELPSDQYSITFNGGNQAAKLGVNEVEVKLNSNNTIFDVFSIYVYDNNTLTTEEYYQFRYTDANALHYERGKSFRYDKFEVTKVNITAGTATDNNNIVKTKLTEDEIKAAITLPEDSDYALYSTSFSTNEKKAEHHNIKFKFGNFEKDFEIIVSGGQKPIHTKTATWYDWILLIPIAFLMQFFSGALGQSLALGILITTIIIRTVAWPVYASSNNTSIKMNLAQPEIQRVQAKYGGRKDQQSQQKMQAEISKIYKKHKINMLGCLVMPIIQFPLFINMYNVVNRIALEGGQFSDKVSHHFLFGIDLTTAGGFLSWGSYVLAILVLVTQLLQQWISQKKPSYQKNTASHGNQAAGGKTEQNAKTMKMVMYFSVIMMTVMTFTGVHALGFYWVIGNTYSLLQTLIGRKLNERKYQKLKDKNLR